MTTHTPDKSEMKAIERVERRLNSAWAKHGFMTLTVSDLRELLTLARASSRPADQVPGLQTARLELTALRRLCDSSQQPFYVEIIDEILAALQAVPASGGVGWQPIESAPKDGTRILIAGGTRQHPDSMGGPEPITQPYIAHWNTLWKQWEGNPTSHDDCYSHEPTHWRPLHAPPALKASGEE